MAAALASERPLGVSRAWQTALAGWAIGCLLAAVFLWPTLRTLAGIWRTHEAYHYAWFIPPLIVFLLAWHHRQTTALVIPQPGMAGVLLALCAAVLWCAFDLMNIDAGRQLAAVLVFQAIALAALGWRAYGRLFPTLALAILMVPAGDVVQPLLRHLTARAIDVFALVLQLPHRVDGFFVVIGKAEYIVLPECSGLPYFLLAGFLGYAFGLLLFQSWHKVLAMAVLGAALGVLSNVLRVCAIVWIDWTQGSQMPLTGHERIQWIVLFGCMAVLFAVLLRSHEEVPPASPTEQPDANGPAVRVAAPMAAGLAVLLLAGATQWLVARAPAPQGGAAADRMPRTFSGWVLSNPATPWVLDQPSQTQHLDLRYQRGNRTLVVRIIETLAPEARLPESAMRPNAANGWHENSVRRIAACAGPACQDLVHTHWENDATEQRAHAYASFVLGSGLRTPSTLVLRAAHGLDRLQGRTSNPRWIGFLLDEPADAPLLGAMAAALPVLQRAADLH